jgi:hypothetical protein
MVRQFLRLFYTLRHIKAIQWRYQFWYRVKNRVISIYWYNRYLQRSFISLNLSVASVLQSKQTEYSDNLSFEFIGLKKSFDNHIDWNFQGHGKLWNYNLQYFSYLLDETIVVNERIRLLRDFSEQLLSSRIKLEPYPISLRIVNTLLFHSRYTITDTVILEALKKQIDYLANNIEYHLLANHLLENAFSLFIASIYLSDQPLYSKSCRLLIAQLDEQILEDGGHYECSVMYQSILLSKLLLCIEAARKAQKFEHLTLTILKEKAAKMLGWINAYSFPDGSWALMNDAAEQIAPTTQSLNEAAAMLNIQPSTVVLASSGYRKMSGKGWELIIKTGPVQPYFQPGHVHADISSYCLWYKGRQVIVDPGISTYDISPRRSLERGTPIHNTLSIDGLNQSDVWGGFRVGKRAQVSNTEDSDNRVGIVIRPFFNRSCLHQRTFIKLNDQSFMIEDRIEYPSSSNRSSIGGIQFAKDMPVQYRQDVLQLDDVSIQVRGVEAGGLKTTDYALAYHQFQTGLRFEYQGATSSSFTFQFR